MPRRGHQRSDYLFWTYDIHAVQEAQLQSLRKAVDSASPASIQEGSLDDAIVPFVTQFRLDVPVLTEGAASVDVVEAEVDISGDRNWQFQHGYFRGDKTTTQGIRARYFVPFAGDGQMFKVKPSTHTTVIPSAVVEGQELLFVFERPDHDVVATKVAFEHELGVVKQYLGWLSGNCAVFNQQLPNTAKQVVSARRDRLNQLQSGTAAIGIQIRKSGGSPIPSPAVRRPVDPTPSSLDRYDVALTFAGEDRGYVEEVARGLRDAGVTVFYDDFEKAKLWGKNLVDHLASIYQNQSRYVVMFISQHYVSKAWPNHERQSAQARQLMARDEYILPARFDDTEVPGLTATVGHVDLRKTSSDELVKLICDKIGRK